MIGKSIHHGDANSINKKLKTDGQQPIPVDMALAHGLDMALARCDVLPVHDVHEGGKGGVKRFVDWDQKVADLDAQKPKRACYIGKLIGDSAMPGMTVSFSCLRPALQERLKHLAPD